VSEEPKGGLQFERAEFAQPGPTSPVCAVCGQSVWDVYYAVNGRVLCERCRTDLELNANQGSRAGRFLRAAAYGLGAGAVGAGVWYGVRATTGYELGLIAIGVGLFVGGAVRKGSNGRGGWRYQALAMFLTYASIVSTYVPVIMNALRQGAEDKDPGTTLLAISMVLAFVFAFAAPFLGGAQNIMGIVIIGIALYEAWKMNKKVPLEITGPHRVGAAGPGAPPLEPGRG
jgi:hypothetical protein